MIYANSSPTVCLLLDKDLTKTNQFRFDFPMH
eukprot:COSAG03_NODE_10565_length_643_cov_0.435662_1_plen_31_part_10